MNDELRIELDPEHNDTESGKIITITTDDDIKQLETLAVEVDLVDIYAHNEGFNVYLSESNLPSSSNYDLRGDDVFTGVKLIELFQSPTN